MSSQMVSTEEPGPLATRVSLEPAIDSAPVQAVGTERPVSVDPLQGGTQSLAISDGGALAARIDEPLDGLGQPP